MSCPYCGKKIELPAHAKINMRSYGNPHHVKTDCCGKIVYCTPYTMFDVEKSRRTADDWGDQECTMKEKSAE